MQLQNLSATETVRQILQTNGARGLYAGMSAMLLQVSCKAAIRCAALGGGGTAGMVEATLSAPLL